MSNELEFDFFKESWLFESMGVFKVKFRKIVARRPPERFENLILTLIRSQKYRHNMGVLLRFFWRLFFRKWTCKFCMQNPYYFPWLRIWLRHVKKWILEKIVKSPPCARKCLLETSVGLGGHPKTFWDHLGATCVLAQKHSYLNGQKLTLPRSVDSSRKFYIFRSRGQIF